MVAWTIKVVMDTVRDHMLLEFITVCTVCWNGILNSDFSMQYAVHNNKYAVCQYAISNTLPVKYVYP